MSREIRRVPLDFDWPLNQVWEGYLMPDRFAEHPCPDCTRGYSPHAERLFDLWHGHLSFDPESTGSTPLRHDTPAVRAFAERSILQAPDFYGTGEAAIVREAKRLAELWNGQWAHHLSQDDVDALAAAEHLRDFTHTWSRETGWQQIEPPVAPTAAQVNEWSLSVFSHNGTSAGIAVRARCEREGVADECETCQGYGATEAYPGQRADAEAWEPTQPPTGEGWQMWNTVTEGSPVTPVYPSAPDLALHLSLSGQGLLNGPMPYDAALRFVNEGWAPSMISTPEHGVEDGPEAIARIAQDRTETTGQKEIEA